MYENNMYVGDVICSPDQVAECQEIRFRVYCRERRFLRASDYPGEIEQDEFDPVSTHLGVFGLHNELLGTARIVHNSELGFPLERYAATRVPEKISATTGEVSRLAVPRSASRQYLRTGASHCGSGWVSVKLYQVVYAVAKRKGLTHLIAAMEPALVRVCASFGIGWQPIGAAVNYGGLVRPYIISLEAFDANKSPAAIRFRKEARRRQNGSTTSFAISSYGRSESMTREAG
jgi:N-acyl amino acid synthase of PEP-CTERM/exosortase system